LTTLSALSLRTLYTVQDIHPIHYTAQPLLTSTASTERVFPDGCGLKKISKIDSLSK